MIGWVVAAQLAVVAHAPASAIACAPFQITAAARAPGTIAPRIALPDSPRLELLASTVSSRREIDGAGREFSVTEAAFEVATRLEGRVALPSVTAEAGALRGHAASPVLDVEPALHDENPPVVTVRAHLENFGPSRPDVHYVGEQVDYVIDVHLNASARQRLRRNPTFFPPEMPAVMAYDLSAPQRKPVPPTQCFERLTYHRALFPLFAGRVTIAPAVLAYSLPVSPSFFSREEAHEVRTDSVVLGVQEPPRSGRPAAFDGAVGSLHVSARIDTARGRMGDPFVVTMRVEGAGNIKLLPRPLLGLAWASVVPGTERVTVDTTHALVQGAKEFDWLVTPRIPGQQEVPGIPYTFFDPITERYDIARTAVVRVMVGAATMATADTTRAAPRPAIRTRLRDPVPPALPDRPQYWLLLALAPLPATLRRVQRVRRRAPVDEPAVRRLQRAATAGSPLVARDVRRWFLAAMHERVPALAPATARRPLARQLRLAGVTVATADAAERMLDELDAAAFGGGDVVGAAVIMDAARLAAAIDDEAIPAPGRPGRRLLPLVFVAMLAPTLSALSALPASPQQLAALFATGVEAYAAGDVARAQRQFARVADRAPRAADAWANAGTAAWVRGDTVHAVAAWQHALRLDPRDDEVREQLDALPAAAGADARGHVPPVPVDAIAVAALVLWIASWLALALPPTRRPRATRSVAGGTVIVAVVLLGGALGLRDRLDVRGLGVIRGVTPLRDAPASSAAAPAQATTGQVGTLGARDGAWVRIALDATHAGWVPVASVLPLDALAAN